MNEAKFTRRGSSGSLLGTANSDADDDTKSVASMRELYASTPRLEVSRFTNRQSKDPPLLPAVLDRGEPGLIPVLHCSERESCGLLAQLFLQALPVTNQQCQRTQEYKQDLRCKSFVMRVLYQFV